MRRTIDVSVHYLRRISLALVAATVSLVLSGCVTTWQPIPETPRVALTPMKGQVTIKAVPGKAVDGMVPVDVSIANGTDEPYRIESDQIFAIDQQGQRIMPIPASQAMIEAGNANALKAGLTGAAKSAAVGGIAGAAAGAAIGAAVGTIVLSPAQGALVGAALGGSVGAAGSGIYGGLQGQAAAHHDAESQISALSLQTRDANPNYSVNGYVFFPKGEYTALEMNLFNEETHQSATGSTQWNGAATPVTIGSATEVQPASPPVPQTTERPSPGIPADGTRAVPGDQ